MLIEYHFQEYKTCTVKQDKNNVYLILVYTIQFNIIYYYLINNLR